MMDKEKISYVRIRSHRSRKYVTDLVGHELRYWWSMYHNYHVYEVPTSLLEEALKFTGVTRTKPTDEHHRAPIGGMFR